MNFTVHHSRNPQWFDMIKFPNKENSKYNDTQIVNFQPIKEINNENNRRMNNRYNVKILFNNSQSNPKVLKKSLKLRRSIFSMDIKKEDEGYKLFCNEELRKKLYNAKLKIMNKKSKFQLFHPSRVNLYAKENYETQKQPNNFPSLNSKVDTKFNSIRSVKLTSLRVKPKISLQVKTKDFLKKLKDSMNSNERIINNILSAPNHCTPLEKKASYRINSDCCLKTFLLKDNIDL